ncbi:uncharacterized protein [Amphiura filiformis]|uniref:uncharacterized protein n=1 Tax=Amphiura filiformis TaxID=82378 RepID=UPI003B20BA72
MAMCPYLKHLLSSGRFLHEATKLQTLSSVKPLLGSPTLPNVIPLCKIHSRILSSPKSYSHIVPVEPSSRLLKSLLGYSHYPVKTSFVRTIFTTNLCCKRKKQIRAVADDDSDEEMDERGDETDDDEDDDVSGDEDESGVPKDYKDIHHNMSSLRIDAVLSKGLNISRKKVEDDFLSTKLRLNGNVVVKKGKQVKVGDTVDLIRGSGEDDMVSVIMVMRLVVKKVLLDKTAKGNTRVVLRRWKNLKVPKSEFK